MIIGGKIKIVIVIDEFVPECLAEDQQHGHRQKDTDAENRPFTIRACRAFL
jgi:hypothetical protein